MLKKIPTLILLSILSSSAIANKDKIINNLKQFIGEIKKENISKTPVIGIFEVINTNPIQSILVSADGKYLIQGSIINLKTKSPIAINKRINNLKRELIKTIDDKDKIIFKAKKEKYVINVFTDIDCPYCVKLHSGMKEMNNLGISVKYIASPIAALHPEAQKIMEKIWCAKDKAKAIDEYKRLKIIPNSKPCKNPVATQMQISKRIGVNGTPSIFLANGDEIKGYMQPQALLQTIKKSIGK